MIALSIYGSTNAPDYAAVWVQRPGPVFVAFHGLDGTQYQDFADTWAPQGYTPSILTATGSVAGARFAGVFELTNAASYSFHGLDEATFKSEVNNARDAGYRVAVCHVYGTSGDHRYIVSLDPNQSGLGWATQISAGADYQDHFDAYMAGYNRPALVSFNDAGRYLSLWRNDSVGTIYAHQGMTSTDYQTFADTYAQSNFYPISVQGAGSGNKTRYAAVFAQTDQPLPTVISKTGQYVPELDAFDDWAEKWIQQTATRAGALAIVKDCKLVLARGYTNAESGYPITEPDTAFCIASCAKPLTGIAMQQHFDMFPNQIDATSKMLDYFGSPTPFDNRTTRITVFDLLTHQGGWDRDVSYDAMFRDVTIRDAMGLTLAIDKTEIFDYMTLTQPLDFTPSQGWQYSNHGFSVLGQILESFSTAGLTYEQIVHRDVFAPLGITRPFIGGSLRGQEGLKEVRYHMDIPDIDQSVMSEARPWVPGQYGGWNVPNMDAHGGWVMTAPDFAKVLAAFDLGNNNPILSQARTDEMWAVAPGYATVLSGWRLTTVMDSNGNNVPMYRHCGKLEGTRAIIGRRADNISFVFFTNGDKDDLTSSQLVELSNIANWPDHDLFPSVGLPPCPPVATPSTPTGLQVGEREHNAPRRMRGFKGRG